MPSFDPNASDDEILRRVQFPDVDGMTAAEKKSVADEFRRNAGAPDNPVDPVDVEFAEFTKDDEGARLYAPQMPSPRPREPWGYILLAGCVIVGGASWLSRSSPIIKAELRAPPGWEDLAPCSALESLDEMKGLALSDDQSAKLEDVSPPEDGEDPKSRVVEGTWTYNEGSKRYAVTLNGQTTTYTLVARGEPRTCILFKGDLHATDLSASWFSFPSNAEPPDDDRERPDPY